MSSAAAIDERTSSRRSQPLNQPAPESEDPATRPTRIPQPSKLAYHRRLGARVISAGHQAPGQTSNKYHAHAPAEKLKGRNSNKISFESIRLAGNHAGSGSELQVQANSSASLPAGSKGLDAKAERSSECQVRTSAPLSMKIAIKAAKEHGGDNRPKGLGAWDQF